MCIYICVCVYAYVYIYMSVRVCTYIYTYTICMCVYICLYMCVCKCVCVYIYGCVCVYIYIYIWILVICLYFRLRAWLVPCSGVSVVDFEQVNAGFVLVILMTRFLLTNDFFNWFIYFVIIFCSIRLFFIGNILILTII